MAQTLKEYLEEQRKKKKTPYFTDIPAEGAEFMGTPPGFVVDDEFTEESQRMFAPYEEWDEPHPEFGGAPVTQQLKQPPPPKPTAETVTPGGEIPEDYRKKHGLSKEAHWAYDQKIPEAKEAIPTKPTEADLEIDFEDRRNFRQHSGQMAMQQFGLNPLTYNHAVAMEEARRGPRMEKLFNKVMMGKSSFSMIDDLPPDLKKYWTPHEHRLMGQMDLEGKENLRLASSMVKNDMMQFDNIQKEAALIPTGIRSMLKSINRKVDPDDPTKFYTHVEPGEEAYMIKRGQEMLREPNAKYQTAAAVISAIQTTTLDNREKKNLKDKQHAEALAAIPGKEGWVLNKDDVDAAKIAIENALKVGVSEGKIIAALKVQGWKDDVIPNLFPKDFKPVVAQAPVSQGAKGGPITVDGKTYPDWNAVKIAAESDPAIWQAAKPQFNQQFGE